MQILGGVLLAAGIAGIGAVVLSGFGPYPAYTQEEDHWIERYGGAILLWGGCLIISGLLILLVS